MCMYVQVRVRVSCWYVHVSMLCTFPTLGPSVSRVVCGYGRVGAARLFTCSKKPMIIAVAARAFEKLVRLPGGPEAFVATGALDVRLHGALCTALHCTALCCTALH